MTDSRIRMADWGETADDGDGQTTASLQSESSEPKLVCSESDLQKEGRKVVTVNDRQIVVFYYKGNYHALDRQCYHAGGPLQLADIEDIQGHPCIICPWHRYIIRMDNGEGLYKSIDPHDLKKPPKWASKGKKQRTHQVTTKDGHVFVQLSDLSNKFPSDYYYSEEYNKLVWTVPQLKKTTDG